MITCKLFHEVGTYCFDPSIYYNRAFRWTCKYLVHVKLYLVIQGKTGNIHAFERLIAVRCAYIMIIYVLRMNVY